MTKSDLLPRIIEVLEEQYHVMLSATREAAENATGDETKSEGKYDTRATEAAYLAEAQAVQVGQLSTAIATLRGYALPAYELTDPIGPGALVETDLDGETGFYLLVPVAGGTTLEHLGCELTLLTPDAPLYQQLLGRKAGDMLEHPPMLLLGVE